METKIEEYILIEFDKKRLELKGPKVDNKGAYEPKIVFCDSST